MAQITSTTDRGLDLTVRKVCGVLTIDDVLGTLAESYAATSTRRVIWDLTAADLGKMTADDLRRIADMAAQYGPRVPVVKTAAVVSSPFGYGLTRMFQALRERHPASAPFMSFHKYSEALAWLESDSNGEEE